MCLSQVRTRRLSRCLLLRAENFRCLSCEKNGWFSISTHVTTRPDAREKLKTFGIYTSEGTIRTTVLIDPEGKVRRVFPKVRVDGHAQAVLDAIE